MGTDPWVSYFRELCSILDSFPQETETAHYRRLLWQLHNTEFKAILRMDRNRIADALELRRSCLSYEFQHPVCLLELMVSLAMRLETDIMQGTAEHDRTADWFWEMVGSLGLSNMTDEAYDEPIISAVLNRFIHRRYSQNGKGGLFTVHDTGEDMRRLEIWYQAALYLNGILRIEGFIDP